MTPSEIEAALNAAFNRCDAALHPLTDRQKHILLQAMQVEMGAKQQDSDRARTTIVPSAEASLSNPLEQLTVEERQAFLTFVSRQERQSQPWKITLLNDWLNGRSSGAVQFIRERYGIQWVEQITPTHLAQYISLESDDLQRLSVGDRIEVTNGLWEWVQETGPCSREWFPCTVISIKQVPKPETNTVAPGERATESPANDESSCIIRFQDGTEYEIQGMYDWNRPNWRWLER